LSACRESYQGDQVLARLLEKQGVSMPLAELRALVAGVAAAAIDRTDTAWLRLILEDPSPALAAQLAALKEDLAPRPSRVPPAERLKLLRAELARRGLAGFIVPRGDEHQGEYVPPRAQRLAFLTGFTGSAGLAIVLAERAALFVDGRYTLQARQEVDMARFELRHISEQPAAEWLAEHLKQGDRLGIDPWLHTPAELERYGTAAEGAGALLAEQESNPIDAVWPDQPPPPLGPVRPHDLGFAGRSAADKRADIAAALVRAKADAAVLTAPDSIAWLLNIRGSDVPHTPLPLSFAMIEASGATTLYIDRRKLLPETRAHLAGEARLAPVADFAPDLDAKGAAKARILLDQTGVAAAAVGRLLRAGAEIVRGGDPCALPKACKNDIEIQGTRAAHRRDGAALTRFLAWLAAATAANEPVREIAAADRLEAFRREGEHFRDLSFPTISGAGPNGAIVHYRASPASERSLAPGELYLLDSGAQYLDGTTDVTRTMAIGTPSAEQRDRFTRVLKGHIALATARFPQGTTGSQLDVLARVALWQAGVDYDHGTGHGVGSYLGVHEGPQRISKLPNTVALKPGMIVSNEPGYYKTGEYGIRIENLVLVVEAAAGSPAGARGEDSHAGSPAGTRGENTGAGPAGARGENTRGNGERPLLGFETLTLAPIDTRLVDLEMLTPEERGWLNDYHRRVRETLTPLLDAPAAGWLAQATRPI
jgi:Xaa-Pro aminopeptidase